LAAELQQPLFHLLRESGIDEAFDDDGQAQCREEIRQLAGAGAVPLSAGAVVPGLMVPGAVIVGATFVVPVESVPAGGVDPAGGADPGAGCVPVEGAGLTGDVDPEPGVAGAGAAGGPVTGGSGEVVSAGGITSGTGATLGRAGNCRAAALLGTTAFPGSPKYLKNCESGASTMVVPELASPLR
jgi:hypothetical protein